MPRTITVEEAAGRLGELVDSLASGDEIVLVRGGQPVARIVPGGPSYRRRQPGNCRGMLIMRREDEEHLKDFGAYLPRE